MFDGMCDTGPAKIEISLRENLVLAVREATFDVGRYGLEPFTALALDAHELVAEKLRTLYQRAQPRDLSDLWFYLTETGVHLEPATLRRAADAKFELTRARGYRSGTWQEHLGEIETTWSGTLLQAPGEASVVPGRRGGNDVRIWPHP